MGTMRISTPCSEVQGRSRRPLAFLQCLILLWVAVEHCHAWLPVQQQRQGATTGARRMSTRTETEQDATDTATSTTITTTTASEVDWDWQKVAAAAFLESANKPILLFDGVCNFCNGGVNMCLDLDDADEFRFASLQSKTGQALLMQSGKAHDDLSSLVLVMPDRTAYFQSEAVLRTAERLQGLPGTVRTAVKWSRILVPSFVRNSVYKMISNHRHMFGESDAPQCRIDWDGSLSKRFLEDPSVEDIVCEEKDGKVSTSAVASTTAAVDVA